MPQPESSWPSSVRMRGLAASSSSGRSETGSAATEPRTRHMAWRSRGARWLDCKPISAAGGETSPLRTFGSEKTHEESEDGVKRPVRIWWARPKKLCALERPGGGGRSHRPERRTAEIEYLVASRGRLVVSTMTTRHGLATYEEAGLEWHHVPVESCASGEGALEELLGFLRRDTRRRGAGAVPGHRHTDFVAALCAAHLHEVRGVDPARGLAEAAAAGLMVTPDAAALLGVDYEEVAAAAA